MATKKKITPAKPKQRPVSRGAALSRAIEERARALNLNQTETGDILGIARPSYTSLLNGQRWWGAIQPHKLAKVAEFLDVPLISVYMLAEVLYPADFYRETTLPAQVQFAFEMLARDRRFTDIVPPRVDWDATPISVQLSFAILYQQLSAQDLLEKFKLIQVVSKEG